MLDFESMIQGEEMKCRKKKMFWFIECKGEQMM